jgi:hypothetical protein
LLALAQTGLADGSRPSDAFDSYSTAHAERFSKEKVVLVAETKLDPATFALNSFAGKYRIVRFEVKNLTDDRIELDAGRDRFVARGGTDKVVAGVLNLGTVDGTTWDKIDKERRNKLAYPKTLDRQASIAVYVFFPADQLTDTPRSFEWTIAESNRTFKLTKPPTFKK